MREIKFRAWHTPFGDQAKQFNEMQRGRAGTLLSFAETNPDEYKIMQYTGLKDKNGTEIYEGDIVHFKTDGMSGKGYVYWNDEIAQFWIKDIREVTKRRGQRFYPFWKNCVYRIDGNIYANPELLEI